VSSVGRSVTWIVESLFSLKAAKTDDSTTITVFAEA